MGGPDMAGWQNGNGQTEGKGWAMGTILLARDRACVQESCRDVLKVQLRLRCFRVASRNGGRTAVWGICSEAPVYTRDGLMRDTK
jgi:hypothetical protein